MAAAADLRGIDPIPDEELIKKVEAGDESAFEVLYERYFPRVYRFVDRRMRNRADTEETVQEVFINVFSSLGSYRGEAPFAAWVLGVTRRTIASRFKKKQHNTVPIGDAEDLATLNITMPMLQREPTPLEHYECEERIGRLERAVARLTQEQRTLFELHHLHHRPIQELARTLRKSEDAVKSNLYRARRLLLSR
jgi:RNA polymerase sigma-70 factor (ECF subfamily)